MENHIDVIIIGAGPGGLQVASYLQRNNIEYILFESKDNVGYFFEKYPRHKQLVSINKLFSGSSNKNRHMRWDWNSLISFNDKISLADKARLHQIQ